MEAEGGRNQETVVVLERKSAMVRFAAAPGSNRGLDPGDRLRSTDWPAARSARFGSDRLQRFFPVAGDVAPFPARIRLSLDRSSGVLARRPALPLTGAGTVDQDFRIAGRRADGRRTGQRRPPELFELQVASLLGIVRLHHRRRQREPVLQRDWLVEVLLATSQVPGFGRDRKKKTLLLRQRRRHPLLEEQL